MAYLLAIDPGNEQSGFVIMDMVTARPAFSGKVKNEELRASLLRWTGDRALDAVAIEMIASYGMAVGRSVFETCVWIGRFSEICEAAGIHPRRVYRKEEKLHICGTMKAKDANIRQALVDRFAYNVPNYGKGTKAAPGWFYGFKADVWQAYAVGITALETEEAA